MGRSERKRRIQESLYSQPTGTLTICPSSLNTVMFTFEERYRPSKAGVKSVCLLSDFSIDSEMKDTNEDLHIKCIGVKVQFMAEMNNVQNFVKEQYCV